MAVVTLLRHFGRPCCWELASVLRDTKKKRVDSAGVKLIVVGVGTPDKARILAERLPFPLCCLYADLERKTVRQLQSLFNLMDLLLDRQSATGRISTGGSTSVPGENGQLKSEILARVSVFGLEHTTLLRRQLAAYDAEARKIRGKKAKANFLDEVPTAQKSTLKPTAAKHRSS